MHEKVHRHRKNLKSIDTPERKVISMATISENKKNGKTVSYRIVVSLGRDADGKQIRRFRTWIPSDELTPAKARKAAEKVAELWEEEVRTKYQKEKEVIANGVDTSIPPEKREDEFATFVNDTWLPLRVKGGNNKPVTVTFYKNNAKMLTEYFKGTILQQITPMDIQKYWVYLRTEYVSKFGTPLSPKTTHHLYATLNLIFAYAEKQGMIATNPMRKVDAPKKNKKPVDALTQEQASMFFERVSKLPLDFRCMMLLFATTGIRRSECIGLKWKDFDENDGVLHIQRGGSYTPEDGIVISTPKTVNSIRTVPLMFQVVQLLSDLRRQTQREYPYASLKDGFFSHGERGVSSPRDPNAITRRVKRVMRTNGLPDLSPHDLRHSCATLLLAQGADIKVYSRF